MALTVKTVGWAAALCTLLVLVTGCGSGPAYSEPAEQSVAASAAANPSRSGERRPLGDDLSITVSGPISFVPTDSAYPKSPRALGFDVTVENHGTTAYRPTVLVLTATADGATARQVIDSTQGYAGMVGDIEIAPGAKARFSVAFGVPEQRVTLQLSAQPDPASRSMVMVFEGLA